MKQKTKIAILIDRSSNSVGGMELSYLRHVKFISEYYEILPITVCFSEDEKNWQGKVEVIELIGKEAINITISDTFQGVKNDLLYTCLTQHLVSIIEKYHIGILQLYGAYQLLPFSCSIAAIKTNIRLIISFRGSDFNNRMYHTQFAHLQKSIENANYCTFVNSGSKATFNSLFPKKKSAVIYNFIDTIDFIPTHNHNKKEKIIIGCSGNFRRVMGMDVLLKSFENVNLNFPNTHLMLIGDYRTSEKNYYQSLIENSAIRTSISITGVQEHHNVAPIISQCDIMVFPSVSEGCPNKVLESMYSKKAIVASDIDGINDLIVNNESGFLVPFSDIASFTNKIEELIKSENLRLNFGNKAYHRVNTFFTKEISLNKWLEVYENTICT